MVRGIGALLLGALLAFAANPGEAGASGLENPSGGWQLVAWDSLPLQWAITSVRGSGRRKIAVLSDPNCRFCRRFEEELAKLDDITVHVLPYPVIDPRSVRQAKAVWCSEDRAKAWDDLMFRRIEPRAAPDCDTPIDELVDFGRRLGANTTPTWFLETGERYSGALRLEDTRRLLDAASPVER